MSDTREFWTCGMHPQILNDKPGACPICAQPLKVRHPHTESYGDFDRISQTGMADCATPTRRPMVLINPKNTRWETRHYSRTIATEGLRQPLRIFVSSIGVKLYRQPNGL